MGKITHDNASWTETANLEELFSHYREFMKDLAREQPIPLPIKDFIEFKNWWSSLDSSMKERCRKDYLLGYSATFQATVEQLRQHPLSKANP